MCVMSNILENEKKSLLNRTREGVGTEGWVDVECVTSVTSVTGGTLDKMAHDNVYQHDE